MIELHSIERALSGSRNARGLTQHLVEIRKRFMSEIEFRRAVPNLPVSNAKASISFFTEKMGFSLDWDDAVVGTPDVMYASLSRGDFQICVDQHAASKAGSATVWGYVSDVRALYEEFKANGVPLPKEPEEMPWGEIELDIRDLDGNGICFTQPAPKRND